MIFDYQHNVSNIRVLHVFNYPHVELWISQMEWCREAHTSGSGSAINAIHKVAPTLYNEQERKSTTSMLEKSLELKGKVQNVSNPFMFYRM